MSTKIFYFTGTGNSLAVAQDLANALGDAQLLSIPKVLNENIDTKADKIGFIFPVYMWGIPSMVVEFVEKLYLDPDQYIFAVATCAGQPGETLVQLQNLLETKGINLNAGFAVREAANTIQKDNLFIKMAVVIEHKEKVTISGKDRLSEIVETITHQKTHKPETSSRLLNMYGGMVYSMAMPRIKTMGNFYIDETCNSCQTCQKICPADNIQIVDEKPVWDGNCEFCQACVQWCPRESIHIKNEDLSRRYHNPQIRVKDILLR